MVVGWTVYAFVDEKYILIESDLITRDHEHDLKSDILTSMGIKITPGPKDSGSSSMDHLYFLTIGLELHKSSDGSYDVT